MIEAMIGPAVRTGSGCRRRGDFILPLRQSDQACTFAETGIFQISQHLTIPITMKKKLLIIALSFALVPVLLAFGLDGPWMVIPAMVFLSAFMASKPE